jgi:hypothetical protein
LKNIIVDKNNMVYNSNGDCNAIIETSTGRLIQGCANTVIPNNVYSIADYAFLGCKLLTNLYIPESVYNIPSTAFEHCESLNTIVVNSNNKI